MAIHKDVSGAEIIKTVREARDKKTEKRLPKRFNLIGGRSDQTYGAERIRNWLGGIRTWFQR